jgi:hypothetical protein
MSDFEKELKRLRRGDVTCSIVRVKKPNGWVFHNVVLAGKLKYPGKLRRCELGQAQFLLLRAAFWLWLRGKRF